MSSSKVLKKIAKVVPVKARALKNSSPTIIPSNQKGDEKDSEFMKFATRSTSERKWNKLILDSNGKLPQDFKLSPQHESIPILASSSSFSSASARQFLCRHCIETNISENIDRFTDTNTNTNTNTNTDKSKVDYVLKESEDGLYCENCCLIYYSCPNCSMNNNDNDNDNNNNNEEDKNKNNINNINNNKSSSENESYWLTLVSNKYKKFSQFLGRPYIKDFSSLNWICQKCNGRFSSCLGTIKEIKWKMNVECTTCQKMTMSGSNEEGYQCFNTQENCYSAINKYVYIFKTDENGLYQPSRNWREEFLLNSTKNKSKVETENKNGTNTKMPEQTTKKKRSDINRELFLKARDQRRQTIEYQNSLQNHPNLPIVCCVDDTKHKYIYKCSKPDCTNNLPLENSEEGCLCHKCFSIYRACDECSFKSHPREWMVLTGWRVCGHEEEENEDENESENEKRFRLKISPPPFIPLTDENKRNYVDDSTVWYWHCIMCNISTESRCD